MGSRLVICVRSLRHFEEIVWVIVFSFRRSCDSYQLILRERFVGHTSSALGSCREPGCQLFGRPSSALTNTVNTPRGPVPNERRRRRPPHGRLTGTTGEWPPATRGSPPAPS